MTNYDYEKASVEAALGQRKLAAVDAKITETEQALVYLLHQRREIVNQYDLNKPKCPHSNALYAPGLYLGSVHPGNRLGSYFCQDCGSRIEL